MCETAHAMARSARHVLNATARIGGQAHTEVVSIETQPQVVVNAKRRDILGVQALSHEVTSC
jgi:hypothetical protein